MAVSYNAQVVRDGLVSYLDAGNVKSYSGTGAVWYDLSGSSLNANFQNDPAFIPDGGGSLFFDVSDGDYAQINLPATTSYNTFTYGAWVYSRDTSGYRTIIDQDNDDWLFATYEGELICYDPNINSGYVIEPNKWYYVNMTHTNGGPVRFYVNGDLVYTSSNNSTNHTTSYFGIGAGIIDSITGDLEELWIGNIAQVSIYNRELTSTEIQQNYNATKGRFSNLIGGRLVVTIVTTGLILNLDAGNTSSYPGSGTAWTDLSGSGNNGTLVNAPTYSSANGGSIVFDGVDDRVTITNTIPSLSNFTIELFMQTSLLDETQDIFFDQYSSLRFEISSNKYRIHLGDGSTWVFTDHVGNTTLSLNTWYHSVWTWNGSTSALYLNGVSDGTRTYSAASSGTGDITLGQHTPDTSYNWNGRISNIRIYNRALSAAEIQQNYNALRGRFGI